MCRHRSSITSRLTPITINFTNNLTNFRQVMHWKAWFFQCEKSVDFIFYCQKYELYNKNVNTTSVWFYVFYNTIFFIYVISDFQLLLVTTQRVQWFLRVLERSTDYCIRPLNSVNKNQYELKKFSVKKGTLPLRWISSPGPFDCRSNALSSELRRFHNFSHRHLLTPIRLRMYHELFNQFF